MKTETGLTIVFLVGILFKVLHWPGAGPLLVISLMTIALLYFPGAFYFFSDKTIKKSTLPLSIISGLFLSIIPIGILFKLQYWPGAQLYLAVGSVTAAFVLGVTLFLKSKAAEDLKTYYIKMTIRTAILTTLTILLYLIPTATLLKIQYWDDPELARLKTLHYTHPDKEEYRRQHDDYIMKRDSLYIEEMPNEEK